MAGSEVDDTQNRVRFRWSLSAKLSVLFSVIVLVILCGLVPAIFVSIQAFMRQQIIQNQLTVASSTMGTIDRFLYERQSDLTELAAVDGAVNYATKPASVSPPGLNQAVHEALGDMANWQAVSVLDVNGHRQVNLVGDSDLDGFNQSPVFTRLLQSAQTQTMHSDVLSLSSMQAPVMVFLTPVRRNGKTIGFMEGAMAWQPILGILGDVDGPSVYLVDSDGRVIGDSRPDAVSRVLKSRYSSNPSAEIVSSFTEKGYLGYQGEGWQLMVSSPQTAASSEAMSLTRSLALAMAGGGLLAVVAATYIIRRQVVRPIKNISAAVDRISLGDLSQVSEVKSHDELGALSQNFNIMTEQLSRSYRQLEATSQVAKENHAQLESSINGLRQGFILTDVAGKVVLANPAATDLILSSGARHSVEQERHPSGQFTLGQLDKILPSNFDLSRRIKRSLQETKPAKVASLPLGSKFLNLYISPVLHMGRAIGSVVLLEDVTEERIMQRSRDEFFSIASHELRTPLTAIKGNSAMLLDYFASSLKDPSFKEMVEDIHTSSDRLIEIVNDFLDMSRLEQGKTVFKIQPFQISTVLERIAYEMKTVLKPKGLKLKMADTILTHDALPLVMADPDRTKQIIYNLVGNAVKFTRTGGVTISAETSGRFIKVRVSDTGSGIPSETQDLLFRKFQQASTNILTRDSTRGTGLGLYISKLLIEEMGGKIGLESTSSKGTTFFFTLPMAPTTKKTVK